MHLKALRELQQDTRSRGRLFELNAGEVVIDVSQALTDIRKTDPAASRASIVRRGRIGYSRPRVLNSDDNPIGIAAGHNAHIAALAFSTDSMTYGIFDQRLQNHRRYAQRSKRRLDIKLERQ